MKVAFVTCVQLGRSCIEEILRIGGKLGLLITLEDEQAKNKSGRIYLDDLSQLYGIPLLKIRNINEPAMLQRVKEYGIDWLLIIGWSQIAKPEVLNAPSFGCIGMHPTLLPLGRGRAAVPWAILKGLDRTGVTLFKLDEGVDTGDIIGQEVIELREGITATELYRQGPYCPDSSVLERYRGWNCSAPSSGPCCCHCLARTETGRRRNYLIDDHA